MVYLTDKVDGNRISDAVRGQHTEVIEREQALRELPEERLCSARTDAARERLCVELGLEPLERLASVQYEPGDVAIVGQLGDGPTRWVRHSFT